MRRYFAALALGLMAAAIGSAAALAAPPADNNKNTQTWSFTGCSGSASSFTATKSTSSGTSFELANGTAFLIKSISQTSPPGDTFTNNGWTNHADNSDETITCSTTSPVTGIGYSVTGVFVPHKE